MKALTTILLAALLGALTGLSGCNPGDSRGTERWVTTEDTNVEIDWDAVGKAYKEAEGPEDFERRINEIYAGDEVVSVAVKDQDEKTQVVTGFFDKNKSGSVDEGEQIFTLQREITGENSGNYQVMGHGPYAGYRSPMWDIAAGMVMGSMISRALMPGYSPLYTRGYTTSPSRMSTLRSQRSGFRAANPGKFKKSNTGRSYGSKGNKWGSRPRPARRFGGGGRFGVRSKPKRQRVRLAS